MKTKTLLIIIVTFCTINLYSQNSSTQFDQSTSTLSLDVHIDGQSGTFIDPTGKRANEVVTTTGPVVFAYVRNDPTGELMPGPCYFNLDQPDDISSLAPGIPGSFLVAGTWANGSWFGEEPIGNLYEINHYDGSMTLIGSTEAVSLTGMAWNGQTMYGCGTVEFGIINMETGAGTVIGLMGNAQYMIGIASDYEGNIYGIDAFDDNLYLINTATGAATIIGSLGIDIDMEAQDMEYDKDNDLLYLAGIVNGVGALYTVNTSTGAATLVGEFMNGTKLAGFAIPYGNPVFSNDLGVADIISPSSGMFLTDEEPVVVQVSNFGVNAQSNFNVSYTVNNGSPVVESIAGPLNGGETYEYTFTTTADLSADGSYTFEACTELNVDDNPENDCTTKIVVNSLLDYCDASTDNENEWISKVIFGSISQESDWQGGVADYTDNTETIAPGGTEVIYVINGLPYPGDYVSVWVDWNNDTTFQIDSEEEISLINDGGTNEVYYGNIEVPFDLAEGNYRMRVRLARNNNPNPCGPDEYGEVEDYTIVVDSIYVGIEPAHAAGIQVYPNPASDVVNINSHSPLKNIGVYNQTGQRFFSIDLNAKTYKLNTSGFPSGIYLLRIEMEARVVMRRVIIN